MLPSGSSELSAGLVKALSKELSSVDVSATASGSLSSLKVILGSSLEIALIKGSITISKI